MRAGGFDDDIIEVIEDRVKKAGGGIGYMLENNEVRSLKKQKN